MPKLMLQDGKLLTEDGKAFLVGDEEVELDLGDLKTPDEIRAATEGVRKERDELKKRLREREKAGEDTAVLQQRLDDKEEELKSAETKGYTQAKANFESQLSRATRERDEVLTELKALQGTVETSRIHSLIRDAATDFEDPTDAIHHLASRVHVEDQNGKKITTFRFEDFEDTETGKRSEKFLTAEEAAKHILGRNPRYAKGNAAGGPTRQPGTVTTPAQITDARQKLRQLESEGKAGSAEAMLLMRRIESGQGQTTAPV